MDLGTIKKNLEKKKYKDFDAFKNDIVLVANNCKTYNARNSDVHKLVRRRKKEEERIVAACH